MSDKDRLTGLLTDQYLRGNKGEPGELDMEFQRARRFNRELAFILMEPRIDDPARADMLYAVLKALAHTADAKVRDIDISVRWGQQVLLVLPETGKGGAETVEGKIRETFSGLTFTHPETERTIPVELRSIVLVFPHDGADKETVLYNLREGLQSAPPPTAPAHVPAAGTELPAPAAAQGEPTAQGETSPA